MEEWSKVGDASAEASPLLDSVNFYRVPVGVKPFEQRYDYSASTKQQKNWRTEEDHRNLNVTPNVSQNGFSDRGFEASGDTNNISSSKRGSYAGNSNKQRVLSVRAATMLVSLLIPSLMCL